jgi:hypothetical protein
MFYKPGSLAFFVRPVAVIDIARIGMDVAGNGAQLAGRSGQRHLLTEEAGIREAAALSGAAPQARTPRAEP